MKKGTINIFNRTVQEHKDSGETPLGAYYKTIGEHWKFWARQVSYNEDNVKQRIEIKSDVSLDTIRDIENYVTNVIEYLESLPKSVKRPSGEEMCKLFCALVRLKDVDQILSDETNQKITDKIGDFYPSRYYEISELFGFKVQNKVCRRLLAWRKALQKRLESGGTFTQSDNLRI